MTFIRRSELLQEIAATLSQRLLFLNPIRIMPLIEKMIELIEVEVGETFDFDVLAGLIRAVGLDADAVMKSSTKDGYVL